MYGMTDRPFELVVVENGSNEFQSTADRHVRRDQPSTYTDDWNAGADVASGDYFVHIGIDVLVGEHWLESMLECFEKYPDCGVATTAVSEPGHIIGTKTPTESIAEAFYGALMMFRRGQRLDPAFPNQMNDYDLCMRIYDQGLRSYRNNNSHAFHMKLEHNIAKEVNDERFKKGVETFADRWRHSPWLIGRMIFAGSCKYGDEDRW